MTDIIEETEKIANKWLDLLRMEKPTEYVMVKVLLSRAMTEAVKARDNKIKSKIGFLRMWLNENRIDDHKKMVTNEQIEEWLFNFEPTKRKE
jgi:uncharacterized protein YqeY